MAGFTFLCGGQAPFQKSCCPASCAQQNSIREHLADTPISKDMRVRLLKDMDNNCISKAVIQQINPPNKNSADIMEEIVTQEESDCL